MFLLQCPKPGQHLFSSNWRGWQDERITAETARAMPSIAAGLTSMMGDKTLAYFQNGYRYTHETT
jgi:hypothetical protein